LTDARWTSADASQLFLCAFVIPIPFATTLKIKQDSRRRELEGEMAKFLKDLEAAINLKPGQNAALDRTN